MKVCILVYNHIVHDARIIRQADALFEAGADVTVIGVRGPNYFGKAEWIANKPWKAIWYNRDKESLEGKLNWFKTSVRSHTAKRILSRVTLKNEVAENAITPGYTELIDLAAKQQADVYHANELTMLPVGYYAGRRAKAKVIYDVHEFYTDEEENTPEPHRALLRAVESKYIGQVDHVVAVSEGMADALVRQYNITRPTVIRNFPPLSWMPPTSKPKNNDKLSILYHGNLGFGTRGLQDLLGCLAYLDENIEIHLRGRLSEEAKEKFDSGVKGARCSVFYHGWVSIEESMRLIAEHDVGLVLTQPTCTNNRVTIATKMFDYLLGGLAIVTTNVPGLKWLTDEAEVGFTYSPGDGKSLGNILNSLARDRKLLRHLQENARQAALERYNWDVEKQKLLSIYQAWNKQEKKVLAQAR